jgi:hypothetical protein
VSRIWPPRTGPSAAIAIATTTSILCNAFSFAIRQPRLVSREKQSAAAFSGSWAPPHMHDSPLVGLYAAFQKLLFAHPDRAARFLDRPPEFDCPFEVVAQLDVARVSQ